MLKEGIRGEISLYKITKRHNIVLSPSAYSGGSLGGDQSRHPPNYPSLAIGTQFKGVNTMELATINNEVTMSSIEILEIINEARKVEAERTGLKWIYLRHDNFMSKVPKVLGEENAPKFSGTQKYGNNNSRQVYNLPQREAFLMVMSESYELQAKLYDAYQKQREQIQSINPNQILSLIVDMQKQFLQLNSNVTALINNMAVKNETRIEIPKYYQTFQKLEEEKLDVHLYHRITIYGKKFRPDLDQSTVRDRAKEIGMMASRLSKEKNIQIIKEDNLDGRFQNKISYYHQNVLKEVFDLIF